MTETPLRIGVLSPLLAGDYVSAVLSGVTEAAGTAGARVVGIQTLDLSQGNIYVQVPHYTRHAAWDQVAGFVVLVNAVDRVYLEALRAAGKQVVLVANEVDGFDCPVVRADNQGGMRQAVDHLVAHGHRRIAFVGSLVQSDIQERHAAYVEALRDHGIAPDEGLLFECGDNLESGGEASGREMLSAGLPSTAVVAATDFNALGVIRVLAEAGVELPRDQAIVGFNDVPAAASVIPTLSTVRQSFETTGKTAATLLLDLIGGAVPRSGRHLVPTSFVPRESCGCSTTRALRALGEPGAAELRSPRGRLRYRLERLLVGYGEPARDQRAGLDRAVELISTRAAGGGPAIGALREAAESLFSVSPRWTTVRAAVDCLREYHRETGMGEAGSEAEVTELAVELSRSLARHESSANTAVQLAMARQFQLSIALLGGRTGDFWSLDWLSHTQARAACLGLWSEVEDGGREENLLHLAGSYFQNPAQAVPLPAEASAEGFPPTALLEKIRWEPGEVAVVLPVRTSGMDMGLLALVTPVETTQVAGRDVHFENSAFLSVFTERGYLEAKLRHDALHDPLTGLPNRTLLLDRLGQALARAERRPSDRVALLFLDLDGFKQVNDALGHAAGDRLLSRLAQRISARLRYGDTAARLGGDEFAILLEDVHSPADVQGIAADLSRRIAEPFDLEGEPVVITAAIGAVLSGSERERPDDLLRNADVAMYRAKATGISGFALFEPQMYAAVLARRELESELRRSVAGSELRLQFQPIVEMETRRLVEIEALVRWQHPVRGLIAPLDFIPIAEQIGAIHEVEHWVLEQALDGLSRLGGHGAGGGGVSVSVNLSPHRLRDPDLIAEIRHALSRTGIPPNRLTMEVTESALLSETRATVQALRLLKEMGLRLAIDDFGAGYSSLTYLSICDFDVLKIDRALIARMVRGTEGTPVARAIVTMARILNLEVVAEGVETVAQAARLEEMGCHLAQGNYFSPPLDIGELRSLLDQGGGGCIAPPRDLASDVRPRRPRRPVPTPHR
ncbi:MAG TPA: EAL domain-containing protein [Candidatus Binatia bacterium]|nr:EAL domain-containing protein [Candidatus Binatia bacterium]